MRFLFLLCGALAGTAANAADLLEVYREALTQDAQYSAARSAWSAAQERLPQGRAGLLPSATLTANTAYNDIDVQYRGTSAFQSAARTYNTNGYTVSLTQPLYRKQNFVQYREAGIQLAQAEAQLNAAGQDLALRVALAYFEALLAQNNVELAGAQKAAISEQLEQARRNFEVGNATITDTHEAQAKFDLVSAQEIAARNDLEIKKRALQQITGKKPETLTALGSRFGLKHPEPDDMEKWVEEAQQANPQVAAQQAVFDFAAQEVTRNYGGHYPTLDLVASYSDNAAGGSTFGAGSDTVSKVVSLQLNLPLYQGGATQSRVREAVANQEKARQDLENARRTAAHNARQAFLGLTSGIAQVKALEQAVVSSQSSLDSTVLGQEVGVRTGVDVLNAQQQLYSARRDLAQARYTAVINELKLKAAAGRLGEDEIVAVNQRLGD